MTQVDLVLPGYVCSVSAPSRVIDALEYFYPLSLGQRSDRDHPTPSAEQFRIVEEARGWSLLQGDVRKGTFAEAVHALLALEYEIERSVIDIDDGRFAFHAGAVETAVGAWLIAGDPDTGKTSSTFQLLQLGQSFLCEEVSLYDPSAHAIHPYPQTLALERRYIDRFKEVFPVDEGALWTLDDSVVRFIPDRFSRAPVRLHSLLLPRYRPGAPSRVDELGSQDVLTEFLGYCFRPSAGNERLFDGAIALLEKTRLLRVTYGSLAAARDLYRGLLELQGNEI